MTTVAWDGTILAADRLATIGNLKATATKIRKAGRFWYAIVGRNADAERCREWLAHGARFDDYWPSDLEDTLHGLAIDARTGRVYIIDGVRPVMALIEDPFIALGSGGDFAIGAMALGKTAAEAIEVAAQYDSGTGHGVDFVVVKKPKAARSKSR